MRDRVSLRQLLCFPGLGRKRSAKSAPQWQRDIQGPARDLSVPLGLPYLAVIGYSGSDLVGVAWARQDVQTCEVFIYGVAIDHRFQERGNGRAAFEQLINRATVAAQNRSLARMNVTWKIHQSNEASRDFAGRLGASCIDPFGPYERWGRAYAIPVAQIVRQVDREPSDREL